MALKFFYYVSFRKVENKNTILLKWKIKTGLVGPSRSFHTCCSLSALKLFLSMILFFIVMKGPENVIQQKKN